MLVIFAESRHAAHCSFNDIFLKRYCLNGLLHFDCLIWTVLSIDTEMNLSELCLF